MKNVFRSVFLVFAVLFANYNLSNAQTNLILNPGFEDGLAPWEAYSGLNDGSHASIDSTGGYTGENLLTITTPAVFASGESGAGVGQNGIPCKAGSYIYSAWVKGDSTYLGVILKGLDSDGFEFVRWVGGSDAAAKGNPDNWEKVTYTFDVVADPGETDLNLRLFIYSIKQSSGTEVLVDDASLVRNIVAPTVDPYNLVLNPGFEDGIGSWISRGSDSIAIDATDSHTGSNSLIMTKPTWASGAVLEGIPCKRITYTYSAWLKGDSSYIFPLLDGLDQYGDPLATHYWGETDYLLTNPDTWTHVSYTFTVDPEPGATDLVLRLIVISKKVMPDTKIWVDDVSLVKSISPVVIDPNNKIVNPGFEDGLAPWEAYSGFNDGSHASIDSTGGYTGAKLVTITTPAVFASGESGAGIGQNGIPCIKGNYTYSAKIMGDSTYLGVILKGLDADGFEFIRWVGGSDAAAKGNPDAWENVTYTFDIVSEEGDTDLNLRLFIYSIKQSPGSKVMVDDASLILNYGTGIPKSDKELVTVYPNPVVDKLHISLVSANSEVSIYSATGKLISKTFIPQTIGVIDVSGLARGAYIVKVDNKCVQKFVK